MHNFILPFFNSSSTFLYLSRCAEPLKIVGPDIPKWVNNISPKSSYIVLFFSQSTIFIAVFFKDSPWSSEQVLKDSPLEVSGTNEGLIVFIVCPSFLAISYPSPFEPVDL